MRIKQAKDILACKKMSIETAELKGYKLIKEYFVDKTGFGAGDEPALKVDNFLEIIDDRHIGDYAFMTNEGQFQVYIGIFSKTGNKVSKRIANNTILHEIEGKRAIRLHNTDILKEVDGGIALNSGGYQTHTTKERINRYLSKGCIRQKDFEWFYISGDKKTEFKDNMVVDDSLSL